MLNQRSRVVDIQALQSVTNAQYRLAQMIGVLQNKIVHRLTGNIRGGGMRRSDGVESSGIEIGVAAGQKYSIAAIDKFCYFRRRQAERNAHRLASGELDRGFVLRNCALRV